MHGTTFYYRYAMSSYGTRFFLTMVDVRWLLRWQVLIESSTHGYIDELKTTADTQSRDIAVKRQLEESQIVSITGYIYFTQMFVFFFTEISRFEIFATGKDDTIELSHYLTEHFYIVSNRNQVRNTTVHQHRVHVSVVYCVLRCAPSQRDTNQWFFTYSRLLGIVRLVVKLLQFRCVWRHTLSLCLHGTHTTSGYQHSK